MSERATFRALMRTEISRCVRRMNEHHQTRQVKALTLVDTRDLASNEGAAEPSRISVKRTETRIASREVVSEAKPSQSYTSHSRVEGT